MYVHKKILNNQNHNSYWKFVQSHHQNKILIQDLCKKSVHVFGPKSRNKTAIDLDTNYNFHSFKKNVQIFTSS